MGKNKKPLKPLEARVQTLEKRVDELAAHITGADFGHRVVKAVELGDWA